MGSTSSRTTLWTETRFGIVSLFWRSPYLAYARLTTHPTAPLRPTWDPEAAALPRSTPAPTLDAHVLVLLHQVVGSLGSLRQAPRRALARSLLRYGGRVWRAGRASRASAGRAKRAAPRRRPRDPIACRRHCPPRRQGIVAARPLARHAFPPLAAPHCAQGGPRAAPCATRSRRAASPRRAGASVAGWL